MVRQFPEDAIKLIKASLPAGISHHRLDLLPRILDEWSRTDLRAHLSRESHATLRKRFDQVRKVGERADLLRQALGGLDQRGISWIALEAAREEGSPLFSVSRDKLTDMKERLKQEHDFLIRLAAASLRVNEKDRRERGQPRNTPAYLVMMDVAAIFEWLTGRRATREVDRINGKETGQFWHFAAAVWPWVFGKGVSGLPAAMKNWEKWHLRFGEESQLIRNIAISADMEDIQRELLNSPHVTD